MVLTRGSYLLGLKPRGIEAFHVDGPEHRGGQLRFSQVTPVDRARCQERHKLVENLCGSGYYNGGWT